MATSTTTTARSCWTPTRRSARPSLTFACFEQTGSAYAVVGAFADRRFPARAYGGAWAGQLRYGRLTHSRTLTVLRNPAYAGAYVFGRRRSRRQVDPDVGIHWRSGASSELTVLRPAAARNARAQLVLEILRELGPTHTNAQLAAQLNQSGHLTAGGRPFDEDGVRWLRWQHRIPSPSPLHDDEIGVHDLAERLGVGDHVIYVWVKQGKLHARRAGRRRLAIPFNDEIEATCRRRLADSPRTRYRSQQLVAGGAE